MCNNTLHTNIRGCFLNQLLYTQHWYTWHFVCNIHSPFSIWNNWRFSICSSFAFVRFIIAALLRHPKHPVEHIQVLGTEYLSFPCVAVHNDGRRQAKHRHICPFQSWRLRAQAGIWHVAILLLFFSMASQACWELPLSNCLAFARSWICIKMCWSYSYER